MLKSRWIVRKQSSGRSEGGRSIHASSPLWRVPSFRVHISSAMSTWCLVFSALLLWPCPLPSHAATRGERPADAGDGSAPALSMSSHEVERHVFSSGGGSTRAPGHSAIVSFGQPVVGANTAGSRQFIVGFLLSCSEMAPSGVLNPPPSALVSQALPVSFSAVDAGGNEATLFYRRGGDVHYDYAGRGRDFMATVVPSQGRVTPSWS